MWDHQRDGRSGCSASSGRWRSHSSSSSRSGASISPAVLLSGRPRGRDRQQVQVKWLPSTVTACWVPVI